MKKILLAICLAAAVSCVGKIDLPQHDTPPHLQGTEQEDGKDEGKDDTGDTGTSTVPPAAFFIPYASPAPLDVAITSPLLIVTPATNSTPSCNTPALSLYIP